MKRITVLGSLVLLVMAFSSTLFAAPIDLSAWRVQQFDFSGGQSAGKWVLSSNHETVTQVVNADPSMYLNNTDQTSYEMEGSWKVTSAGDDDFIGFVFGYQDDSHFYLLDWKQGNQSYVGKMAYEGFSVKKIAAPSKSQLSLADFWSSTNTAYSTILSSKYNTSAGWKVNTLYDFYLDFQPGEFQILISQNSNPLWDITVNNSAYTHGQFGFYNFSQANVQYSGFEQTGGVPVGTPLPVAPVVFGITSLLSSGFLFRKVR